MMMMIVIIIIIISFVALEYLFSTCVVETLQYRHQKDKRKCPY